MSPVRETYVSTIRVPSTPVQAAVVYCSDGRFAQPINEFLTRSLKLERYDHLVLPGGPCALMDRRFSQRHAVQAAFRRFRFLLQINNPPRVILIQHDDCLFYKRQFHLDDNQLREAQDRDARQLADLITTLAPTVQVEIYYARLHDDKIHFEPGESFS